MRSRSLVCNCLRTSQFESAMERCTKRKKYFRFVLVVLARTIQQPRDTSSKVCSIRKSALQISLGPPSSVPFLTLSSFPPLCSRLFIVQHAQFKFHIPSPINEMQFVVYNYRVTKKYFAKLLNCHKQCNTSFAPRDEIGRFVAIQIYVEYSAFQVELGVSVIIKIICHNWNKSIAARKNKV